ncbi:MAG: hypothetical protein MAG471_01565 [Acidimicrobiaceae bacterium]|nr:hypothetical protein [Acidimicrobiaceae bacterium]
MVDDHRAVPGWMVAAGAAVVVVAVVAGTVSDATNVSSDWPLEHATSRAVRHSAGASRRVRLPPLAATTRHPVGRSPAG